MSLIRYTSRLPAFGHCARRSALRDVLDRLFDFTPAARSSEPQLSAGWTPAVDVYEDNGQLTLRYELPGLKAEEIEISLRENTLSVSGERKNEREAREGETFRSERYFGRFQRSLELPYPVENDQVKAQYTDGVLTVALSKAEAAKPRRIEIQS